MPNDLKTERFKIICHLCDKEFIKEDLDKGITLMANIYDVHDHETYFIQNYMNFNPVHLECFLDKLAEIKR